MSHRKATEPAQPESDRSTAIPGDFAASDFALPTGPSWVELVPGGPVTGRIRVPGSKSLTNRALAIAAFADGESRLVGGLRSDDTAVMMKSLQKIGVRFEETANEVRVRPPERTSFSSDEPTEMFVGNSGTTIRFLTAMLSRIDGHFRLFGIARMHQRPIGDLVDALAGVVRGAVRCESNGGCPPVVIRCNGWSGNSVSVRGSVSSQYLSGLLMAAGIGLTAPTMEGESASGSVTLGIPDDITIEVAGELVSLPYIRLTLNVMQDFGVSVDHQAVEPQQSPPNADAIGHRFVVRPSGYRGTTYAIEPDASAASYFWAAAAVTGGKVAVADLSDSAMQGDVKVVEVLERMGCVVDRDGEEWTVTGPKRLRGVDVDMNEISDTVQTIAPIALFADRPTRIRGVAHNRFKETDRITDLATELRRFGTAIEEHDDGLTIHPLADPPDAKAESSVATDENVYDIQTYDDHRMAMGMSLVGLRLSGVRIHNPSCTAKTYPEFFHDLQTLCGRGWRWRTEPSIS